MKKYFLKSNNQEVELGDTVEISTKVDTTYGKGTTVVSVKLTEENLEKLCKDGFIRVVETEPPFEMKVKPYLKNFARRNGVSYPLGIMLLRSIAHVSPLACLDVLLEAAAELENTIEEEGEKVWVLNPMDGYIPTQYNKKQLSSNVIYFRRKEGALKVHDLLSPIINEVLGIDE